MQAMRVQFKAPASQALHPMATALQKQPSFYHSWVSPPLLPSHAPEVPGPVLTVRAKDGPFKLDGACCMDRVDQLMHEQHLEDKRVI